ncbi:MAG: hypothetical protein RMK15_07415 [Chloroflexota bacterium]|nr:hypothetical protein [Dehalococcoidia bacterium]MDW8047089.1 hypothetical protein [Chloroflexota bacterium]
MDNEPWRGQPVGKEDARKSRESGGNEGIPRVTGASNGNQDCSRHRYSSGTRRGDSVEVKRRRNEADVRISPH